MSDDGGPTDARARVRLALEAQLRSWRAALDSGAARVGWKVGLNVTEVEEVMSSEPVFGHLTSATRLEPGGVFHACGVRALRAEAEVAVEIGRDLRAGDGLEAVRAAVAGFAPALELVDVEPPVEGFEGGRRGQRLPPGVRPRPYPDGRPRDAAGGDTQGQR